MRPYLLMLTVAALAAAPFANADHGCETEEDAITVGEGEHTYHVLVEDCTIQGTCFFSVWVFQETNGEPGLQRGHEWEDDCEGDMPVA